VVQVVSGMTRCWPGTVSMTWDLIPGSVGLDRCRVRWAVTMGQAELRCWAEHEKKEKGKREEMGRLRIEPERVLKISKGFSISDITPGLNKIQT
jgi:hypothetical protein